jgi:phospholipase/carboxylesterase
VQIKTDGVLAFEQWTVRYHLPDGDGSHPVLLLIHGWTGDENVMWIFTPHLSPRYLILAPRGLHKAADGGYGWEPHLHLGWPQISDFRPSVDALLTLLDRLKTGVDGLPSAIAGSDFSSLNIMGFSQGAALVYTLALLHPERIQRLAGLAGFIPEDASHLVDRRPLSGKQVFVAHGQRDERVPVEKARTSVRILEEAGASVTYCEEDVGHKLSVSCFHALEKFFELE